MGYSIHMTEFSTLKKVMNRLQTTDYRLGGGADYPHKYDTRFDAIHSALLHFISIKQSASNTSISASRNDGARAGIPRVNIPIVRNILE